MNWVEKSRATVIVKKICGLLILIAALYLIYTAV